MLFNFMKLLKLKKNFIWLWNFVMVENFLIILSDILAFQKSKLVSFILNLFQVLNTSIRVEFVIGT